ncbi:MAG: ABC transporter permease [Bacteroidetes bacterium]|nr:MAG: ABC transporter permease [Bacteroidota bacterium]
MSKFFAAFRKEWILLIRDLPGLGILFVMPVLLILVVTLAQENALKSQVEKNSILMFSPPGSILGRQVKADVRASGMYTLAKDFVSLEELHRAIQTGSVPLGIVIAPGDSAITLVIDPTLHQAYRNSLIMATTFILKGAAGKVLMQQLFAAGRPAGSIPAPEVMLNNLPPVYQEQAVKERSSIKPTPVQNNIPGFILFAMFFIVIPLSGSVISEKNEGASFRLRTLPTPLWIMLGAKVLLFLLVCIIQFLLMLLVGYCLLHLVFGFPELEMGSSFPAMAVATVTAALGAIGFGLLVGAGSRTHNQAALFGSVMVVILGVISGTFLPIHVMPKIIRIISGFSPIRWGIDNYLELFIRDGTLRDILPRSLWLLLFFIFALLISLFIFQRRD